MKPILSVLLALMLCLFLCACGKQPVETPTEPPTEPSVPVSTCPPAPTEPPTEAPTEPEAPQVPEVIPGSATAIFKDDGEHPVLELRVNLPACEALPQIDGYYKAVYDDLYATCALNAEEAAQRRAEFVTDGLDFTPWAVEVDCEITRNDGVTLSVVREVYEHFGSPYPTVTYQCETFDVATQGRLLLGDLFVEGADYQPFWAPNGELEQLNFAITEDAVVVCGENGGSVPLSDLADILKPQYQVK